MSRFDPCSELGATIARLALQVARESPNVRNVDHVVAEIQKDIPEITRREVIESIAEMQAAGNREISDAQKRVNALKREVRESPYARRKRIQKQIDEIEKKLASGEIPEPKEKTHLPPELQADADRLAALRTELRQKINDAGAVKRIKSQIEVIDSRMAQARAKIAAGQDPTTATKQRRQLPPEAEVERNKLLAKRADLRKEIAQSDVVIKKKLRAKIAELEAKLAAGPEVPTPREKPVLTKEAQELEYQSSRLKRKIRSEIERMRPQGWKLKAARGAGELMNFPRAMMSGWDLGLSFLRRQNIFYSSAHPIKSIAAGYKGVRGALSDRQYHARMEAIHNRPNAYLDDAMGIHYTEAEGSLSKREEAVNSLITEKIRDKAKILPSSGRGMTLGMNEMRAAMADTYLATLTRRSGEATRAELKWIGDFVNSATGRGNIYGFEKSAAALNTAFFSPRLNMSRLELLAHKPLLSAPTWRTRRIAAEEYARFYVGAASVLALAAVGYKSLGLDVSIETDPRSSDFLKLKIGDHIRIDMSGGLMQAVVLGSRIYDGHTKSLSGNIVPIRDNPKTGEKVPYKGDRAWDLITKYGRGKLAPVPATAVDLMSGENVVGEPVTPSSAALDLVTPLLFRDIRKIMQENGWKGLPMELQNLVGDGVQYYEDRKKPGSRPPARSPQATQR